MKKQAEPAGRSGGAKRGTGRETAYQVLRERILDLSLQPGTPLDEAFLVRELNLSRTPLREALVRLASEQLVELLPNRGARVADIPVSALGEYFEALSLAQRATHRWAATRRTAVELKAMHRHIDAFAIAARQNPAHTPAFNRALHSAIAAACGKPAFIGL